MTFTKHFSRPAAHRFGRSRARAGLHEPTRLRQTALLLAALSACGASQAIDFGPFTLTGFAKAEVTRVSAYCPSCQLEQGEHSSCFRQRCEARAADSAPDRGGRPW